MTIPPLADFTPPTRYHCRAPAPNTPAGHTFVYKTPAAIINKINADINEALKSPEILQRMPEFSAETVGGTPEETAAYLRGEIARWHKVIQSAGGKIN